MEAPKKGLCRPRRGQWVNVNWVFMKLEADEKKKPKNLPPVGVRLFQNYVLAKEPPVWVEGLVEFVQ